MELLPDDVLITVMQFLNVEDVLTCRLVCRRLYGLALHRDVWRHRSLSDDDPCAGAVLLLAPCLDTLVVTGRVPTLAVTTTRCAVASLELRVKQGEPFNPGEYALAVLKQEALGRLRRLKLSDLWYGLTVPAPDVLARTIASCSGLESLLVMGELPELTRPVVHGPSRPSLTRFRCPSNDCSATFVNTILTAHAATLEEVATGTDFRFEETATAELLAALPRLRSLRCVSLIGGLEAVAACTTLRDVSIDLFGDEDKLESAVKFLRRASQLRRVHLENYGNDNALAMLVEALAGQSHLERLALYEFGDSRPLLRALPSLPALRHLDLDAEDVDEADELLKGITHATAPALRRLELELHSGQCPHALVHGAALKATLADNPLLHIQLWVNSGNLLGRQACDNCVVGCHQEVKWEEERKVGFYSHGPEKCPSPEDHTDDVDWQRGDERSHNFPCRWIHM